MTQTSLCICAVPPVPSPLAYTQSMEVQAGPDLAPLHTPAFAFKTGIIPFSDRGSFSASLVSVVFCFTLEWMVGSVKG